MKASKVGDKVVLELSVEEAVALLDVMALSMGLSSEEVAAAFEEVTG